MKPSKKRRVVIASIAVLALAAAGLSEPGRMTIKAALKKLVSPALQSPPDVERQAQAKHGWESKPVTNSMVRGTITYYDPNGIEVQRVGMTLYRSYPDRVRLEITRDGGNEVSGFDGLAAWRGGVTELREADARDIRAWARMWPDRLFVERETGANYREVGRFTDERAGRSVDRKGDEATGPVVADRVEIEDNIGPLTTGPNDSLDWRRISYYLDAQTSLVYAARWLEPNDPGRKVNDLNATLTDVRVDFARWTKVDSVVWPYEVTHWRGGRADFRIEVSEVSLNQQMPDNLFQSPNK